MTKRGPARWIQAYFRWLETQTHRGGHRKHTYTDALLLMHQKEFVWLVPNDDNRIVDGLDLRMEFLAEAQAPASITPDLFGPCSVLEVLVGLSRRLSFLVGESAEGWAEQLLTNLGFMKFSDPMTRGKARRVDAVLENLIWRNYEHDGQGGFFPLAFDDQDQTKVEIWYQMQRYADELHPER